MGSIDSFRQIPKFEKASSSQLLSSAALDFTTSFGEDLKISHVQIHVDTPVSETMTITIDSGLGSAFDTIVCEELINTNQDWTFVLAEDMHIDGVDEVRVELTNTGATGTASVAVYAFRGG